MMQATILLGLAVTVAAPAPKEVPKKKEEPGIVGSWKLENAEFGGMVLPMGGKDDLSLTFHKDGTVVVTKNGMPEPDNGRYTHDPKKTPAEFDFFEPSGGGKEKIIRSIYKIEGETLTICMSPMGERPTKFESPAGGQTIIMTFKRMKKD